MKVGITLEKDNHFEKYIEDVTSNVHHSFLKKVGNIYLNDDEIQILTKYNINYENCNDYNSLLYLIDEVLYYNEYEDLELVSKDISERNYYFYTNK